MLHLLFVLLVGLGIALFSQQNMAVAPITLGEFSLRSVPVYMIVIASMLAGLLLAWVFSLIRFFSMSFTLRQKDELISLEQRRANALEKAMEGLRLENAQLRESHQSGNGRTGDHRQTFFEDMKERLAFNHRKEAVT